MAVQLDAEDILHLYRSWTGYEVYRAILVSSGAAHRIEDLMVTAPERYCPGEDTLEESRRFLGALAVVLQLAMDRRAGWGDYPPFPDGSPPSTLTRRSWW
ncbi:hypothetical protein SAMN06893096_106235 [Geodermatophilus pulveris]|uniref:Uncharacterized protein n=1 Tax=Geodermatophilus pulveris TaxID=1564159 RepID=A0A239GJT5_9ACTN|nr:hypothetical protein [Geodermatophilus pulveris]SNS69251.1 hypothetical protein SAMN06893096_106235 [Geodermatophilus pulveris]